MTLPFSQSCENNKDPILAVIREYFNTPGRVLEIASGTAQHAEYFSEHLPWLTWQCSDIPSNVDVVNLRISAASLERLPSAIALDVTQSRWPDLTAEYVFSANSLHIMPLAAVMEFFGNLDQVLLAGGKLCIYGPFKYRGEFTSPSNANFDLWLKQRNPLSGIRDFETIETAAKNAGLTLLNDHAMPANNQLLVWQKN